MFRSHTQEVSLFAGVVRARATLCGKAIRANAAYRPVSTRSQFFAQENILNDVSLAAASAAPTGSLRSGSRTVGHRGESSVTAKSNWRNLSGAESAYLQLGESL